MAWTDNVLKYHCANKHGCLIDDPDQILRGAAVDVSGYGFR